MDLNQRIGQAYTLDTSYKGKFLWLLLCLEVKKWCWYGLTAETAAVRAPAHFGRSRLDRPVDRPSAACAHRHIGGRGGGFVNRPRDRP